MKFKALVTIYTKAGVISSGQVFTLKGSGLPKKDADDLVQRGFARVETEFETKED